MNGIKLEQKKEMSLVSWAIHRPYAPKSVRISTQIGEFQNNVRWCVREGQHVKAGQLIAEPLDEQSISIHASISGLVESIDKNQATLQTDGERKRKDQLEFKREGWEKLQGDSLRRIFQASGLMDFFYKKPLHEIYSLKCQHRVHTIILNATESQPYLTANHALMMSAPLEILKGAELLRSLVQADRVVIALSEDQREPMEILRSKIYLMHWDHFEIKELPTIYPCDEAVLVKEIFGQRRSGEKAKKAHLMQDPLTAYSVYEAVVHEKPLFERPVTISGECVAQAKNVWVPFGSSIKDSFRFCKGLLRDPKKVLLGGPMIGKEVTSMEDIMPSHVEGLLALPKEVIIEKAEAPCIRCRECINVCPVDISPAMIAIAVEKNEMEMARDWGASACTSCGNCSYVCPSGRPMVELVQEAAVAYEPQNIFDTMKSSAEARDDEPAYNYNQDFVKNSN